MSASVFNQQSRAASMIKTSWVGTVCRVLSILGGFAYRTIFIAVLSEKYLGISGLFWDVFRFFSLTELGLGTAICYRFYKPIAQGDVVQVGRLMGFFRQVYLLIAGVILLMGLGLFPFIGHLIKDTAEVPGDVNLKLIYLLYLFQSVSTYTFSYRLTIWAADRKDYVSLFMGQLAELMRFGTQILVLWMTKDFTWTLASGIFIVLALNWGLSIWTTQRYKPVFAVTERLPWSERLTIFKDAGALMLHRIGKTIVGSTDSIVISKFVGLAATGLYSNYTLLYHSLIAIVHQLIGGFTSNYGNAYATDSPEALYHLFRRMQFINLAIAGFATSLFYLLVGPFITLWIGPRMCLGTLVEIAIVLQLYNHFAWITVSSHTTASGLFNRDKLRPLIEATLNLVISVWLVREIGLAGVFIGTVVASLATASWRAPYLLFKEKFHLPLRYYWGQYLVLLLLPVGFSSVVRHVLGFAPASWLGWMAAAVGLSVAYVVLFVILYGRMQDFTSLKEALYGKFRRHRSH